VADGAELEADEVIELVAAVWGGGQAEPAAGRDLLDGVLKRGGRHVMAFVDDYKAVAGRECGDVVAAGQGLEGGDVDGSAGFGAPAAALAGLDSEQVVDTCAPLVGERLAVDQDQGGDPMGRDERAGDDCLTRRLRRTGLTQGIIQHVLIQLVTNRRPPGRPAMPSMTPCSSGASRTSARFSG
jgi:hypothetical protein